MAKLINLSTPDSGIVNGMELSFRAPCDCSDVTGVTLAGVEYALVDASGESLSGCSKYFVKNAVLTVIIDTENKKATLLNPRVNTYTKTLGTPDDTASASGTVWARVKQIQTDVSGKAPSKHTHVKADITDFAHNHDERYYTESEMDTKLKGKSDTTHKHVKADIEDFAHNHDDLYFTEAEVLAKLADKSDKTHTHDDRYFTEIEMVTKLAGKSDTTHLHDDRYYTKTEMDDKLDDKSDVGHKHTKEDITNFPTSMPASDVYSWAKASAKPTYTAGEVGAYSKNETDNLLGGKSSTGHKHTKSEITDFPATMPPSAHKHSKSDITDFPTSMPASDVYAWAKATTKPSYNASEVGTYTSVEIDTKLGGKSNTGHTHDDRYYTESEVDSKFSTQTTKITNLESWKTEVSNGSTPLGKAEVATSLTTNSTTINMSSGTASNVTLKANRVYIFRVHTTNAPGEWMDTLILFPQSSVGYTYSTVGQYNRLTYNGNNKTLTAYISGGNSSVASLDHCVYREI